MAKRQQQFSTRKDILERTIRFRIRSSAWQRAVAFSRPASPLGRRIRPAGRFVAEFHEDDFQLPPAGARLRPAAIWIMAVLARPPAPQYQRRRDTRLLHFGRRCPARRSGNTPRHPLSDNCETAESQSVGRPYPLAGESCGSSSDGGVGAIGTPVIFLGAWTSPAVTIECAPLSCFSSRTSRMNFGAWPSAQTAMIAGSPSNSSEWRVPA